MAQVTVRLVGLETLQTGMGKFQHSLAPVSRDAIKEAMHQALVKTLSGYSTAQRGYARTGNLFRGTNVEVDGASVRLKSEAYGQSGAYHTYVIGNAEGYGQARVHAGVWNTARKAVDEQILKLTDGGEMEREVDRAARAAGL
jgi:hypothetical protein